MWSELRLKPGDVITGRWHGHSYRIEQELGSGANGRVYLVVRDKERYALKLGYDPLDLQSEINGLTDLQRDGKSIGGYMVDADDWHDVSRTVPYYVMKYVPGVHPRRFLLENGMEWYPVIGYRILTQLMDLHGRGYIFGDLKSANILVSGYGTTELIDYGGLTGYGKAVRQYTERYDRGYWRAGTRTADPAYDLFAFAILCLELADPDGNELAVLEASQERSVAQLMPLTEQLPVSKQVSSVILACLDGQLSSAAEAREAWRRCVYRADSKQQRNRQEHRASPAVTTSLAVVFALTVMIFGAAVYWTFQPGVLP